MIPPLINFFPASCKLHVLSALLAEYITPYIAPTFLFIFLVLCIFLRRRLVRQLANPKGLPYPPGPKPLPIVGNLFDLARSNETGIYERLAKEYGMSLKINSG